MIVYILHSRLGDTFYVGFTTESIEDRLQRHLTGYYDNKYTSRYDDWEIFLEISCVSVEQSRLIEKHIKKMKSKIYIKNLKRYPEIIEKLPHKYSNS